MNRRVIAGAICLLLLCRVAATNAAWALEAEELRAKIIDTIGFYGAAAASGGDSAYRYDDVVVEPDGEAFRVTIKGLSALLDASDGLRLEADSLGFTMAPAGEVAGDALFRVSDLSVPPSMLLLNGSVTQRREVRIGPVRFNSLWSFAYRTNLVLDAVIRGFEIFTPDGSRATFRIGELAGEVQNREKDGSVYDMTVALQARDLLTLRDSGTKVEIAEIDLLAELTDYDLGAALKQYQALASGSAESGRGSAFGPVPLRLLLTPDSSMASAEVRIDARQGRITRAPERTSLEFDAFNFALALADLNEPLAYASLTLSQNGLRRLDAEATAAKLDDQLLPKEAGLTLTLAKLPLRQVLAGMNAAAAAAKAPEAPVEDAAAVAAGESEDGIGPIAESLRNAILGAEMTIDMTDTRFVAPGATLELYGRLTTNPDAALGVTGSLLAELAGLDELMQLAQGAQKGSDPEAQDGAADLIGLLATLQAYAVREQAADGGLVDRFDLVLDPTGMVTVNGRPLAPAAESEP